MDARSPKKSSVLTRPTGMKQQVDWHQTWHQKRLLLAQLAQQTCTRSFFSTVAPVAMLRRKFQRKVGQSWWYDDHCEILMVGKHHNVVNPTINHPLLTRSDWKPTECWLSTDRFQGRSRGNWLGIQPPLLGGVPSSDFGRLRRNGWRGMIP